MKKLLIPLFFLSILNTYGQQWLQPLLQQKVADSITYFDLVQAFDDFWQPYDVNEGYYYNTSGKKIKAMGWKQFKRWEYYWESRIDLKTGKFPKYSSLDLFQEWKGLQTNVSLSKSINGAWESVGPTQSSGGYAGLGRLNCVAFHPTDNDTYWVGSPSGGLWKTTDDGDTWEVLTDQNNVLGVSSIALSSTYDTDQTLYIATGDRDGGSLFSLGGGQNNDNNSIGVLKSINGGITWQNTGLSFTTSQGIRTYALLMHPVFPEILYASTSIGLYKTTNSGLSWTLLNNLMLVNIKFKPNDPETIFGSTFNGDIYRSTNSGLSFSMVLATDYGRTEIAVTPDDPDVVYAIMNGSSWLGGIFKSVDGGSSFINMGITYNMLGYECDGSEAGSQGSYDLCIAADPNDADKVYVGGVNSWKTEDGGMTWNIMNHWSGTCGGTASNIHADKHYLAFQNNSSVLFECNDGGIYKSLNNGLTWTDKTNGIIHSQFYRIGVSQTNSNLILAGLQDNGSKLLSATTWSDVYGGDGMECIIDYSNTNYMYVTYVNGKIIRSTNGGLNFSTDISANIPGGKPNGAWVAPYCIDPVVPSTIYAGYDKIWKTTDRGNTWTALSPSLSPDNYLRSLAIASSNPDYIYTADRDQVWMTSDAGTNWIEITGSLPVGSNFITYLQVKHDDPNTVWVTFGGYDGNRVYQTTNAGLNWTNISSGLPNIPMMSLVQNKLNVTETELYVSADIGVYIKLGTANWQLYQSGMPNVVVSELDIFYDLVTPANSRLRAGTFGRGLWQTELYTYPTGDMAIESAIAFHKQTNDVAVHAVNQEVIGLLVQTSGIDNPISITELNFSTIGCTNVALDVSGAKVFYTGSTPNFNTTTSFGSIINNPNGIMTFSGSQNLLPGNNYFWLAYDISSVAEPLHDVDATVQSIGMGSVTEIPVVTNPEGKHRIIACVPCVSSGNANYNMRISRVNLNEIDNESYPGPNYSNGIAYSDYTAQSTTLTLGESYDLSIKISTLYPVNTKVWIDWNQDCDFEDLGESYLLGTGNSGNNVYTSASPYTLTVPVDAEIGNTRMRVSIKYAANPTSCANNFNWGEVEDYSIEVTDCNPVEATVWDGNAWSNGVPDITSPVEINGDFILTSDLSCCSMKINNGFTCTIPQGKTLMIQNELILDGAMYIAHEGSLVQLKEKDANQGTGNFTIYKESRPYHEYDYNYWSSPVVGESVEQAFNEQSTLIAGSGSQGSNVNHIYYYKPENYNDDDNDGWDDDSNDWILYSSGSMTTAKGYIALGAGADFPFNPSDFENGFQQEIYFDASKVHNGILQLEMQHDADVSTTESDNLVGNPYPSAIDARLFYDFNKTNIISTAYFWTHDTQVSSANPGPWAYNFTNSDFATLNMTSLVSSAANNQPVSYIASGQGFLVQMRDKAASLTPLVFKNSMRIVGNNDHLLKNSDVSEEAVLWLNLTDEYGLYRQLAIGFYDEAADNPDDFDSKRKETFNEPDFYSMIPLHNEKYAIQGLNTFHTEKSISLGYSVMSEGMYEITLDHTSGIFTNEQEVLLEDNVAMLVHNLSESSYIFHSDVVTDDNSRFKVIFDAALSTVEASPDSVIVYPNPTKNNLYILHAGNDLSNVKIRDITGKNVQVIRNANVLDVSAYCDGVYFLTFEVGGISHQFKFILKK